MQSVSDTSKYGRFLFTQESTGRVKIHRPARSRRIINVMFRRVVVNRKLT
jgi:hypothetical protein